MSDLRECKKHDPITGRKCGLYVPHPMPHKLLKRDRIVNKAGYQRVEWDDNARWIKIGHKRTEITYRVSS